MPRLILFVLPILLTAACDHATGKPSARRADQRACVWFLTAPLVGANPSERFRPALFWSSNDDIDSIAVASDSTADGSESNIRLEAGLRHVSMSDEPSDTTTRFVSLPSPVLLPLREGQGGTERNRLGVLRPSLLLSLAGVTNDDQVVSLRAQLTRGDATICTARIDILVAF